VFWGDLVLSYLDLFSMKKKYDIIQGEIGTHAESKGESAYKMKVIAINGSPRKYWNTHLLLEQTLEGARSVQADTTLYHLYDMKFQGCISCFECKRKDNPNQGKCSFRDPLSPILEDIAGCDALIIGSPIYIGEVTASTRAFLERLTFQYIPYSKEIATTFSRHLPTAWIYTMNVPESALEQTGYTSKFQANSQLLQRIFSADCETLTVTETLQTHDYAKYHMSMFNGDERLKRRQDVFPHDLQKAFELGVKLAHCDQ
jgi:multimeric flavodoxin WrbA